MGHVGNPGLYAIQRLFLYMNTTSIPTNVTVSACTLNLYLKRWGTGSPPPGDQTGTISVRKGGQNSSLDNASYSLRSGVYYAYDYTTEMSYGAWGWTTMLSFNSTGIADVQSAVTAGAITKLCLEEYGYDYLNNQPGGYGNGSTTRWGATVTLGGSATNKPYLEVTYTVPASGGPFPFFIQDQTGGCNG